MSMLLVHTSRRKRAYALATIIAAVLFGAAACVTREAPVFGAWGVDTSHIAHELHPGDDFFSYVNGAWLRQAVIPDDLPSTGVGVQLHLQAEADVQAIIRELAAGEAPPGSVEQQVGDLYASWMNIARLDELGATPLEPHLARIRTITNRGELDALFGSLHFATPFNIGIIPDPADTTRYIAYLGQGGLGMPARDYYLDESERFQAYRSAYRDYIARMLTLAGIGNGDAAAERILALETRLAAAHWPPEESRDVRRIYNPMTPADLAELVPEFDWQTILKERGLDSIDTFVVGETTALQKTGVIYRQTPLDTWKEYLAFHFASSRAPYLSGAFDQAHFDFHGRALNGMQRQRERDKRGTQMINGAMGEAVGQLYVERRFPASSKMQVEELVGHLIASFRERLERNDWMDEATRAQALVKLDAFEPRVGYPEKWTDYSSLNIRRDDLLGNQLALTEFHWRQQLERLNGAVDRALWAMPPQTVNAYYSPLMNQITFPAAFLQPPMFDPNADAAVNYGAIGAVIGHEIGHGFDDQGRRFDAAGRIRDWWTSESDARFSERARRLGAQYERYEPVEGAYINGALTMGENIGDLGGLEMAYSAYHRHLDACCDGEAPVIDGLTGDQRFFLSYAAAWQRLEREDFLRKKLKSDPHSPPKYRVNGVVRNMDAWYDAFGVTAEHALWLDPEERVRIW